MSLPADYCSQKQKKTYNRSHLKCDLEAFFKLFRNRSIVRNISNYSNEPTCTLRFRYKIHLKANRNPINRLTLADHMHCGSTRKHQPYKQSNFHSIFRLSLKIISV